MKTLTVFTPTFNRAHLLPRLYQSLCVQNDKNFIWMVVDDGSVDNTEQLIRAWQQHAILEIVYYRKENEGMHSAHNVAYENIRTPWNTCIDSDDMLAPVAISRMHRAVAAVENMPEYYAVVGLDADQQGNIIGSKFPTDLEKVRFNELYLRHGVTGDKKLVYRTSIMKALPPYPIFKGERFVPLDYKSLLADQQGFVLPVNEVWCIVEYQDDGSTRNILRQYRRNPQGFAFSRVSRIQYGATVKERFKNAIHLVSCTIFIRDFSFIRAAKSPLLILAALPAGCLLNLYICLKSSGKHV